MVRFADAKIVHVSKAVDGAPEEERFILCTVLAPEEVDLHEDIYSAEEIRKAQRKFMLKYQNIKLMHRKMLTSDEVAIVECYIAPCDMTIGEDKITKGTWMMGLHIMSDVIWDAVKNGELTGLSIGGEVTEEKL